MRWLLTIALTPILGLGGCAQAATVQDGASVAPTLPARPLLAPTTDPVVQPTAHPSRSTFAPPSRDERVSVPEGTLLAGSRPGLTERRPSVEADLEPVSVAAFDIDRLPYPNDPARPAEPAATRAEAQRLCAAQGRRLCEELEWERACRGTTSRLYSYGNQRDAEACNTPIEGSGPGNQPAPLAASGAFERCHTPEGVYDLNGNLAEWVSDPWTGAPEPFNQAAKVDPETWRTLRGGTMWSHTFYGQDCTSSHGHLVTFKNMDDGFRCCKTP